MKSIFKYLALAIVTLYSGLFIVDKFDKRPFRFEDFKTSASLELFLRDKFLIGSNIDLITNMMKNAGAKCENITWSLDLPEEVKEFNLIFGAVLDN